MSDIFEQTQKALLKRAADPTSVKPPSGGELLAIYERGRGRALTSTAFNKGKRPWTIERVSAMERPHIDAKNRVFYTPTILSKLDEYTEQQMLNGMAFSRFDRAFIEQLTAQTQKYLKDLSPELAACAKEEALLEADMSRHLYAMKQLAGSDAKREAAKMQATLDKMGTLRRTYKAHAELIQTASQSLATTTTKMYAALEMARCNLLGTQAGVTPTDGLPLSVEPEQELLKRTRASVRHSRHSAARLGGIGASMALIQNTGSPIHTMIEAELTDEERMLHDMLMQNMVEHDDLLDHGATKDATELGYNVIRSILAKQLKNSRKRIADAQKELKGGVAPDPKGAPKAGTGESGPQKAMDLPMPKQEATPTPKAPEPSLADQLEELQDDEQQTQPPTSTPPPSLRDDVQVNSALNRVLNKLGALEKHGDGWEGAVFAPLTGTATDDDDGAPLNLKSGGLDPNNMSFFGGRYNYSFGGPASRWEVMQIVKQEMGFSARRLIRTRKDTRRRRAAQEGTVLHAPHRWCSDRNIFDTQKRAKPQLNILMDWSGSMNIGPGHMIDVLVNLPMARIAYYSSGSNYGRLVVVAENGRMIDVVNDPVLMAKHRIGGNNGVDGPALKWLAKQRGLKVWVSDGGIHGNAGDTTLLGLECMETVLEHDILMLRTPEGLKYLAEFLVGDVEEDDFRDWLQKNSHFAYIDGVAEFPQELAIENVLSRGR